MRFPPLFEFLGPAHLDSEKAEVLAERFEVQFQSVIRMINEAMRGQPFGGPTGRP